MSYSFALLPRDPIPPGAPVLGIEVAPEHAAQCTLGNIYPPHGATIDDRAEEALRHRAGLRYTEEGGRSWPGRAAVDIATEIPLLPAGTVLAVSRVDLGTVAALAVLALRALDLLPGLKFCDARSRIERIATHATYRPSAEWSPRPLPTAEQPWPAEPHSWDEDRELAAIAAICVAPIRRPDDDPEHQCGGPREACAQPGCGECGMPPRVLSLAERVAIAACFLVGGEKDIDCEMSDRIFEACEVPWADPAATIAASRVRVEVSRRALAEEAQRSGCITKRTARRARWTDSADGVPYAILRTSHPKALELGFCVAPVVVWLQSSERCDQCGSTRQAWQSADATRCPDSANPVSSCDGTLRAQPPSQCTIAGWPGPDGQTRYIDTDLLHARLNRLELQGRARNDKGRVVVQPRELWIATADRCTSPISDGTRLSEEAIVREVVACLR